MISQKKKICGTHRGSRWKNLCNIQMIMLLMLLFWDYPCQASHATADPKYYIIKATEQSKGGPSPPEMNKMNLEMLDMDMG